MSLLNVTSLNHKTLSTVCNEIFETLSKCYSPLSGSALLESHHDRKFSSTKDGLNVVSLLSFGGSINSDLKEKLTVEYVLSILKDVTSNTAKIAGDGTTSASLISLALIERFIETNLTKEFPPELIINQLRKIIESLDLGSSKAKEIYKTKEQREVFVKSLLNTSTSNVDEVREILEEVYSSVDYNPDTNIIVDLNPNLEEKFKFEKIDGIRFNFTAPKVNTQKSKKNIEGNSLGVIFIDFDIQDTANILKLVDAIKESKEKKDLVIVFMKEGNHFDKFISFVKNRDMGDNILVSQYSSNKKLQVEELTLLGTLCGLNNEITKEDEISQELIDEILESTNIVERFKYDVFSSYLTVKVKDENIKDSFKEAQKNLEKSVSGFNSDSSLLNNTPSLLGLNALLKRSRGNLLYLYVSTKGNMINNKFYVDLINDSTSVINETFLYGNLHEAGNLTVLRLLEKKVAEFSDKPNSLERRIVESLHHAYFKAVVQLYAPLFEYSGSFFESTGITAASPEIFVSNLLREEKFFDLNRLEFSSKDEHLVRSSRLTDEVILSSSLEVVSSILRNTFFVHVAKENRTW